MRTDSQRWQDMTARLCEMLCEAESQHAQVDNTGGAGDANGQSEVRGQYSTISIVEPTFDSPQVVLKGCPKNSDIITVCIHLRDFSRSATRQDRMQG